MTAFSLAQAAATDGDRIALVSAERSVTYRALAARVELARGWLSAQGVAPGRSEPVALVMRTELETIELFWALWALGRPVLALHHKQRPEVRAALMAQCGATDVDARSWAAASASALAAPSPLPAAGLLMATSGTLGQPKLARLSERALLASAAANWENLGVQPDERWLVCLPLGHVGGLSILTRTLLARRTAVLFDAEAGLLARVEALGRALAEQRATLVSLVPTVLDALLERGFEPPPALRAVLLGGAAASPPLLERARGAGLPVLPSYGLTEAASQVTTRRYAQRLAPPGPRDQLVSSGHPLSGVKLRISATGEIEIAGPTLFEGYWGESSQLDEDDWFQTGDRGALLENGELVVRGRRDEVIVTGGENVDPAAVEAVLSQLRGLRGACVFGAPDPRWGEVVAAALVFTPGSELGPGELSAFFDEALSAHERPRLVALLPNLPLGASGKLDRERVKETARPRLLTLQR